MNENEPKKQDDVFVIKHSRVAEAAKQCPEAAKVLATLFPEAFSPTMLVAKAGMMFQHKTTGDLYTLAHVKEDKSYAIVNIRTGFWYPDLYVSRKMYKRVIGKEILIPLKDIENLLPIMLEHHRFADSKNDYYFAKPIEPLKRRGKDEV